MAVQVAKGRKSIEEIKRKYVDKFLSNPRFRNVSRERMFEAAEKMVKTQRKFLSEGEEPCPECELPDKVAQAFCGAMPTPELREFCAELYQGIVRGEISGEAARRKLAEKVPPDVLRKAEEAARKAG